MMEWKKESNYVIHESGFTVIVEEGSFSQPSSIQIRQAQGFDAIKQAKLLREGLEFGVSNTRQKLASGIAPMENNTPRILIKKNRKARKPEPNE